MGARSIIYLDCRPAGKPLDTHASGIETVRLHGVDAGNGPMWQCAPPSSGPGPTAMSSTPALPAVEVRHTLRQIPLSVAGATGFVGSLCVLMGVVQARSPFVSKLPDAWFFGSGHRTGTSQNATFLGIMLVYVGVALMIGSWYEIVRTLRRTPMTDLGPVVAIMIAWATPVMVMPPLFSRDVYSYAAQGELVARGLNPYAHSVGVLGPSRFLSLVDPQWRHGTVPYGPAWERLSGAIVQATNHNILGALVGFRAVALVGVGLIAWGVPVLARSVGRDPAVACALAVLNPLVLLVLLGGAHNDALMLGLLVAGCAFARRNHIFVGLLMCSLAAEVKIPALIGALFIGWWWSDEAANWRQRLPRVAGAIFIAVAMMATIGFFSGLGWRWIDGLNSSVAVVSWVDPVTAVGLSLSHLSSAVGFGAHQQAYVESARAVGLGLAAVASVGLILRSGRMDSVRVLGWSLLAFVVLGPVIWPWYETWGFVFLAVVAEAWTLRVLLALSAVACFADVPSVHSYETSNPLLAITCWSVVLGLIVAYAAVRLLPALLPLAKQTRQEVTTCAGDPTSGRR
jgi:alpha-1,6-mannosyltransferase